MNVFLFGKDGYDNQTVKIWLCVGLMWDAWMYVIYRNCIHNRVVSYSVLAYFPFLYLFHFFCCFFLSKVPVLTCTGMFSLTDYCYKGHPLFSFHWLKTTFVKCNMMIKKKRKKWDIKSCQEQASKCHFYTNCRCFLTGSTVKWVEEEVWWKVEIGESITGSRPRLESEPQMTDMKSKCGLCSWTRDGFRRIGPQLRRRRTGLLLWGPNSCFQRKRRLLVSGTAIHVENRRQSRCNQLVIMKQKEDHRSHRRLFLKHFWLKRARNSVNADTAPTADRQGKGSRRLPVVTV